jgi:ankyrin repeat protein
MKHLLLTTIAAVVLVLVLVLVGCGKSKLPEPLAVKTPDISIHDAAEDGNIEAVKRHLAAGSDIESRCIDCGGTALGHAARNGHKGVAELLITNGADVNVNVDGTPLHPAAFKGDKEIAGLLISKGADVDAKDENGDTPLNWAAAGGHMEIAELLIASGADVNVKGVDGETALDIATDPENPNDPAEITDLLRKHGGKTGEELKAEGK